MQGVIGLLTVLLLAGYVAGCEFRAPTPWATCEPQWKTVLGVLCPSPLGAIAQTMLRRKRRPQDEEAAAPPTAGR
jgi:hypothetical protein